MARLLRFVFLRFVLLLALTLARERGEQAPERLGVPVALGPHQS